MITLTCVDDSKKPVEVDNSEWIKKDAEYTLLFISWHPNQKCQGGQLAEIALTEKSHPYEFYKLSRFSIPLESLDAFLSLAKDCTSMDDLSIEELIKETEIELA